MTSRLFFFGRTPELSLVELSSFTHSIDQITLDIVRVSEQILTDDEFIHILGGTVKIAEELKTVSELKSTDLTSLLIKNHVSGKLTFGVSGYGVSTAIVKEIAADIKKLLIDAHISARFVLPKEGSVVSSVAIEKEQVVELVIIKSGDSYIVGKTTAVQPFESWNTRDYGRPFSDAKSGMLPPKIARMLVNIALKNTINGKTLLDPFCGMGTVLGEAMLRGVNVLGIDIDKDVIAKAKKNLTWLCQTYKLTTTSRLFVQDATHADEFIDHTSIDAIVTEPFLGTPKIGEGKITEKKEIQKIIKGLEKLYIGSLKSWQTILKPKGVVVIAIPLFHIENSDYSVKKVIDTCENYGYTKILGPVRYSRPQAIVQRNFYILQKI